MESRKELHFIAAVLMITGTTQAGTLTGTVQTTLVNQSAAFDDSTDSNYGPSRSASGWFTLPQYDAGNVLTAVGFSATTSTFATVYGYSFPMPYGTVRLRGSFNAAGWLAKGSGTTWTEAGWAGYDYPISYSTNTATVSGSSLGLFVAGNVAGYVNESVDINRTAGPTIYADPWEHNSTVAYAYTDQAHADGSIDNEASNPGVGVNSLSHTFQGTVLGDGVFKAGEASSPYAFNVFNGTALFGMDIANISCLGDCNVFALTGTFQDIVGGGSKPGSVQFLGDTPPAPRSYAATYTFTVGDDDGVLGAGKSFNIEYLTLNVMAQAVPEPHEWAMMLSGTAIVGFAARRRRPSKPQVG